MRALLRNFLKHACIQADVRACLTCWQTVHLIILWHSWMLQAFMHKCQEVSLKVLACFAIGLGFEEDFFTKVSTLDCSKPLACNLSVLLKRELASSTCIWAALSIQWNQSHTMDKGLMPYVFSWTCSIFSRCAASLPGYRSACIFTCCVHKLPVYTWFWTGIYPTYNSLRCRMQHTDQLSVCCLSLRINAFSAY